MINVAIRNVLFVCTGNICRSPMAAALFAARTRRWGLEVQVMSAGVAAMVGYAAPAPVIALMANRMIDVTAHRGRQFDADIANRQDLILVMEDAHRRFIEKNWRPLTGRVRRLGEWRDEDVYDPYGQPEDRYAACLDHIDACMQDWEARLLS